MGQARQRAESDRRGPDGALAHSRAALRDRARPALLRGADVVGRATSGARVLPGLLICGAQRAGSTSLYQALIQQPTLYRPVWRKGVHWFDVPPEHDLDWYRSHFPLAAQLDRAQRRHGTRALAFESSPYYLFHPLAPSRIAAALPDVRVVVLVRDPVERAHSAHAHEFARGYETLGFEEALAAEADRLAGEEERLGADPGYVSAAHRHQAYLARGRYDVQLTRMADALGRDRVLVVDSHRLWADPQPELARVLDWLGVAARVETRFGRHNARDRDRVAAPLRRSLEDGFAAHDAALAGWLGHEPSWRA